MTPPLPRRTPAWPRPGRRLEGIISELRRDRFGARSEKLDPEQFNLPLEDVEIAQGVLEAAQEKAHRTLKSHAPDKGRFLAGMGREKGIVKWVGHRRDISLAPLSPTPASPVRARAGRRVSSPRGYRRAKGPARCDGERDWRDGRCG